MTITLHTALSKVQCTLQKRAPKEEVWDSEGQVLKMLLLGMT